MIAAKQKLDFFAEKWQRCTVQCINYSFLCGSQNFKMETQSTLVT